jgi:hypothetical protein
LYNCKEQLEPRKIVFAFLTLQCCIDDTLSIHGSNDFTIQHMGKEALLRAGTLPASVVSSATALKVFDLLERGGKPVVNDNKVAKNNQGDKMPL